jgi:hypothetical protein
VDAFKTKFNDTSSAIRVRRKEELDAKDADSARRYQYGYLLEWQENLGFPLARN